MDSASLLPPHIQPPIAQVPRPILEIGNTNSRYQFAIGARKFVESWNGHGPAHHCAVGVGHIAEKIDKLASLLEIESIRVSS